MMKILGIIMRIPHTIWYLSFNTIFGTYCYIRACIHNIGNVKNFILMRIVFRTNYAIIEYLIKGGELQAILKKYETKRK